MSDDAPEEPHEIVRWLNHYAGMLDDQAAIASEFASADLAAIASKFGSDDRPVVVPADAARQIGRVLKVALQGPVVLPIDVARKIAAVMKVAAQNLGNG
jgi:hypothetical protein